MPKTIEITNKQLMDLTLDQLQAFRKLVDAAINLKKGQVTNSASINLDKNDFEGAGVHYSSEEIFDAIHVGNGPLWDKAKEKSKAEYGEIRWPFVMWLYEQMGGKK
jgi:hypothetical protein